MNGTGIKGGAFGFRISSINKLVDTKSVNNTTLLHFLEKTVSRLFPEMDDFLDELEKPAEAYRGKFNFPLKLYSRLLTRSLSESLGSEKRAGGVARWFEEHPEGIGRQLLGSLGR